MARLRASVVVLGSTAVVGGAEVGQRSLMLLGLLSLWTVVLAVATGA